MDTEINELTYNFSLLSINNIIKIQKWYKNCIVRLKQMPLIMYNIQEYLKTINFIFANNNQDGRINSCLDENNIIDLLIKKYTYRIKKPSIRMWYDILVYDYMYGWLPVNIKTTTTLTCDNTGNLTMCVYSYTNEILNLDKYYENGEMSRILYQKIKEKKYNKNNKKDYYFIILNKNNNKEIIVNSVKGLTILTPNINNLPFQVNWSKNKNFKYDNINKKIKLFIECLKKPKLSWKEIFMKNIRTLEL